MNEIKVPEKIEVSFGALHQLLEALHGPAYWIRELQATKDIPAPCIFDGKDWNPIRVLTEELNAVLEPLLVPSYTGEIAARGPAAERGCPPTGARQDNAQSSSGASINYGLQNGCTEPVSDEPDVYLTKRRDILMGALGHAAEFASSNGNPKLARWLERERTMLQSLPMVIPPPSTRTE